MSTSLIQYQVLDRPRTPLMSPAKARLISALDGIKTRAYKHKFLQQAEHIVTSTVCITHSQPKTVSLDSVLDLMWRDTHVRTFFESQIYTKKQDEIAFIAGVLGLLSGYFVGLNVELNRPALILAALCFVTQGRSCHLLVSNEQTIKDILEIYSPLFSYLNIDLISGYQDQSQTNKQSGKPTLTITTPQRLLAQYVATVPYRSADFHHRIISSHFGEKPFLNNTSSLDVVLIDRVDDCLLDNYIKPLTLHRPRNLPGLEKTLESILSWASDLESTSYIIDGPEAVYIGNTSLLNDPNLKTVKGFWKSERVLTELSSHALIAVHALEKGRDYSIEDGKICVLSPETSKVLPSKIFPEWTRQCLEKKESLDISPVSEVVHRNSYQVFFRERYLLAGTGVGLNWNRQDFNLLYGSKVLQLSSALPSCLERHPIYFDYTQLLEAILAQLAVNKAFSYLYFFDKTLEQKLIEHLESTSTPPSITFITSLEELQKYCVSRDSTITTEQVLFLGTSETGRDEVYVEKILGERINRMIPLDFAQKKLMHSLPFGLSNMLYRLQIGLRQRKKRSKLLSEQLTILKSEYGLQDQWI
ncbi:hypothetical protein [Oceanospirillum maris]|uniref:hypothetical protein n=1 Tax=Oceanospirillum maris TaxID=64977 RepID=UPI00041AA145|nr:hypothetical protein [Oceanospirillum maris]